MSELILVRHGQASFGKQSYDKLSEQGLAQVRRLREHWQSLDECFDQVYCGTLLRQIETAHELLPVVAGQPGQALRHEGLNEYDGDPLIQTFLRNHAAAEGFPENIPWPVREERLFQQLFEAATARWIRDELLSHPQTPEFERWRAFQARVHGLIDELMEKHSGGSRVLLSTSGGVIAMTLQRVLGFPDEQVISTNWMVYNSSVTKIKYGGGRVSLTQFNGISHLEHPDYQHMVTYR